MRIAFFDGLSGEILQVVDGPGLDIRELMPPPGMGLAEMAPGVNGHEHKVNVLTNEVVPYTPEGLARKRNPPVGLTWNAVTEDWQDTRNSIEVRLTLLRNLKAKRDSVVNGTFVWDGHTFDSDTVSQSRILGLYTSALNTPGIFPVTWRLADNSWLALSAVDAVGVWSALQFHIQSAFTTFSTHESTITNLATLEALQQYDINVGW